MKASECYPSKFLRVGDLGGMARLLSISSVRVESVIEGDDPKPILSFVGVLQDFVANKTNWTTLMSFLPDDTDGWTGKQVVLYPTETPFGGKVVGCIRVRAPKLAAAKGPKALPVEPSPTPPAKLPLEPAGDEEAMPF
jgi:hypothetical protein